jgi:hypothetical protein
MMRHVQVQAHGSNTRNPEERGYASLELAVAGRDAADINSLS